MRISFRCDHLFIFGFVMVWWSFRCPLCVLSPDIHNSFQQSSWFYQREAQQHIHDRQWCQQHIEKHQGVEPRWTRRIMERWIKNRSPKFTIIWVEDTTFLLFLLRWSIPTCGHDHISSWTSTYFIIWTSYFYIFLHLWLSPDGQATAGGWHRHPPPGWTGPGERPPTAGYSSIAAGFWSCRKPRSLRLRKDFG